MPFGACVDALDRTARDAGIDGRVNMDKQTAIRIARKHIGNGAAMDSSARFALSEAMVAADINHDFDATVFWAARSLAYSVGICHADYKRVTRAQLR